MEFKYCIEVGRGDRKNTLLTNNSQDLDKVVQEMNSRTVTRFGLVLWGFFVCFFKSKTLRKRV